MGDTDAAAAPQPAAADGAAEAEAPAPRPTTYTYEGPDLRGHAEQLTEKRAKFREMGGPERIERQHGDGKLTVRERLDLLFDPGTFSEFSLLAHHQSSSPQ